MKRLLKTLLIAVLAFVLLLFILPFAFKGKIKELVIKEANKNLDAKLEVGPISISLICSFPSVYVKLNDIVITGLEDFEGDTLAYIQSFALSTGMLDLINGSPYHIKKIRINKADVRLKILADGRENWDVFKESADDEDGTMEEESGDFRLLLRSLIIKNSRLFYDDLQNETYYALEGLNHQLSGDLTADFTTIKTRTNVEKAFASNDGVTYLRNAVIDWQADLDADLTNNVYTFRENKLKINDFTIIFDGSAGLPDEGYDLDLTFSTPDQSFKQLLSLNPALFSQDFASITSEGIMDFNGFVKGLYIEEQYPAFSINLNVKDAWFRYPDLPSAVEGITILARIDNPGGDLDNTVIDIENLTANLAGNPVKARFLMKNPISDPYIDTRVEMQLNLSDVQKFYPLEEGETLSGNITADFMLKGRLSDVENQRYNAFEASGNIQSKGIQYATSYFAQDISIETANLNITPAYLDLTEFNGKAGRSDFDLKGKVENYLAYYLKNKTLKGNFNLRSALIDVNDLLNYSESPDAEIADSSALSAFIVPSGIDFTLNAVAKEVKYKNFDLRDFSGRVRIKDEQLFLEDVMTNTLGGNIKMNGSYESSDPVNPKVDYTLGVTNISIRETFQGFAIVERFAPITEKILGNFSGSISLAGLLDGQMASRLESMNGKGNLITSLIEVANVNTLNQIADLLKMDQFRVLKISGTSIDVKLTDGVMDVKPFDFKALGMNMNLGGQTALDQRIGYVLKMKIPRSMMGGAANDVLDDLFAKAGKMGADFKLGEFVDVSALIEGTITDPKVSLNLAGMGNDLVQSVTEQVQEKIEELVDDAKEEAEKYLQEANRQAQAIIDAAQKQVDEILKGAQKLADETITQTYAQADNIIKEAQGQGALTELAAKKTADEVRKQGDKQAQNIINEARQQSNAILDKARAEADKVKEDARKTINP